MTDKVVIIDIIARNMHVSNIVRSLQCKELELKNTNMNQGNTIYLVEAMESVNRVLLVDVTLEIEELCKYSGKGKCSEITVGGTSKSAHSSRLKIWMQRANWIVAKEDSSVLTLTPKSSSANSSPSSAKKVSLSESDEEDGSLCSKLTHLLGRPFAIAKACYDGFTQNKFLPKQNLTFDPAQIAKLLDEDFGGNWPEQFDEMIYIKELQTKHWMLLHIELKKIPNNEHHTELTVNREKYEHILVKKTGKGNTKILLIKFFLLILIVYFWQDNLTLLVPGQF